MLHANKNKQEPNSDDSIRPASASSTLYRCQKDIEGDYSNLGSETIRARAVPNQITKRHIVPPMRTERISASNRLI